MPRELTELEKKIEKEMEQQREAKTRAQNCLVDIKNCLKKWNCQIDPVMQLSPRGIQSSYLVVPLVPIPEPPEEKK